MANIVVSRMMIGDIPSVVTLWNDAVQQQGEGYERHIQSFERVRKIVDDPDFLPEAALVAKQGSEVLGFALGYVQTVDFLGIGDLDLVPGRLAAVAVRPDSQRQGIGRKLLNAVESVLARYGKSRVSCVVYHEMPLAFVRSVHLDSGPYRFLRACGYEDGSHGLVFHNDISSFTMQDWVLERKMKLERLGVEFRWYQPEDRGGLAALMKRCFSPAWQAIIDTAVSGPVTPRILLALQTGSIVGFIGPFSVGQERFYFSTDARSGWGAFGSPGVDSALQRLGIGTVLWHTGLDHLKRSGARFTEYGTGLSNPAQHLYFHSGATLIEISCNSMAKVLTGP